LPSQLPTPTWRKTCLRKDGRTLSLRSRCMSFFYVFSFGAHMPSNAHGVSLSERTLTKWQLALTKVFSSSSSEKMNQPSVSSHQENSSHGVLSFHFQALQGNNSSSTRPVDPSAFILSSALDSSRIPISMKGAGMWAWTACMVSSGFVVFWDWESGNVVHRIDVNGVLFAFFFPSLQMSKGCLVRNFKPHCDHCQGGMLYPLGQQGCIHGESGKEIGDESRPFLRSTKVVSFTQTTLTLVVH
jgi:hypothetical protein